MIGGYLELILFLIFMAVARVVINRIFRRIFRPPADNTNRCACGYSLENMSVPRCPECGRVVGFQATAEELGLTDDELKQAQFSKAKRRSSGL